MLCYLKDTVHPGVGSTPFPFIFARARCGNSLAFVLLLRHALGPRIPTTSFKSSSRIHFPRGPSKGKRVLCGRDVFPGRLSCCRPPLSTGKLNVICLFIPYLSLLLYVVVLWLFSRFRFLFVSHVVWLSISYQISLLSSPGVIFVLLV